MVDTSKLNVKHIITARASSVIQYLSHTWITPVILEILDMNKTILGLKTLDSLGAGNWSQKTSPSGTN